ncbi:hypothetical protein LTS08_008111 [Lithohypha guttulata]|uniref:protein-ribulosamine 3-kinase n=1 Tax=Lithohypha guttulata TaxID=1690604 RepID=A0AAN7T1I6_9EURO|nr:hypothetical protein LTR05_002002 [Lithohypha guttulata]KAK5095469.1 hypothetical protein LTS08_008111 [Lithohypha guttulata]
MPTDIDPAIIRGLSSSCNIDPSTAEISKHGGSGFASTYRINTADTSIFVKTSSSRGAATMFEGEHASLSAIHNSVPSLAPKSFAWGELEQADGGYFLATEFLDMSGRSAGSTSQGGSGLSLATKLAQLHNTPIPEEFQDKGFGFPVSTCCGDTIQDNSWKPSWATFFAENRLRHILKSGEKNNGKDAALRQVVEDVCEKVVPRLLRNGHLGGSSGIQPRVVHGDLWSGNKGRGSFAGRKDTATEEIVFDPSAAYSHHEFDHGIMNMFGGFGTSFWKEYFQHCPKTEPAEEYEDRVRLYEAYHHLNHYSIFGGSYKSGAVNLLKPLLKKYG